MLSTGIDIIEISRIQKAARSPRFLERIFSPKECALFRERNMNPSVIAANFAAKEAFSKALGTGIRGFSLREVSVLRGELGRPFFEFTGRALETVQSKNLKITVSLTHSKDYAAAVVVAYGGDLHGNL